MHPASDSLQKPESSAVAFVRAFRSLIRAPWYSATVIATLALGISALAVMFTVTHGLLISPLPYFASDRLVSLDLALMDGSQVPHSPAIDDIYRRYADELEEVALYRTGSANVWAEATGTGAEYLTATWIGEPLIRMLGARPLIGRGFTEEETRRGGPEAVILSESEWRTRFGASSGVLGRTLMVNDVSREVVGVMPAKFAFPASNTRLWLPVKTSDSEDAGDFLYSSIARLAKGASIDSARHQLGAVLPKLAVHYPKLKYGGATATWMEQTQPSVRVQSLRASMTAGVAPSLWVLSAIAGLVLVVVLANVANLALIRAESRQQDVAIRRALGATELRASAHRYAESLLLGAAAAILAVLVAIVAIGAIKQLGPANLPRLHELAIGPWTGALICLFALVCTFVGTALPKPPLRLPGISGQLQYGTRSHTAGRSRRSLRTTTTVLQIAATLVVLAGAALLLRTAQRLHDVDPGFDGENVTTLRILLPFARYDEHARVAFYGSLIERLGQLGSVQAVGLTAKLPLGTGHLVNQDFLLKDDAESRQLGVNVISPGFFSAMRIPVIAGADFLPPPSQRPNELVISRRASKLLFPGSDSAAALGRTLTLDPGGPTYSIVGVVGDVRFEDLAQAPPAIVYRPQVVAESPAQPGPLPGMVLTVRANAPSEALTAAIREVVRKLDPSIPVFSTARMKDVVRESTSSLSLALSVTTAAAIVSLALGMIGLYGVMAYQVALRTRELGLRMALGARQRQIVRTVISDGLRLTVVGIVVGLIACLAIAPILQSYFSNVVVWDPYALAGATAMLVGTMVAACSLPALRAAAVDPGKALQSS